MKMAGRVIAREVKDFGKGKDAEAKEVHFATLRIDGRDGLPSGKYTFAMTDEEVENHEYDLGRIVTGSLAPSQEQLDLNGRARARRERDQTSAKAH